MHVRYSLVVGAAALLLPPSYNTAAAAVSPPIARAIALSGQAAAGAGGAVYSSFDMDSIVVNESGQVAFTAALSGPGVGPENERGLWLDASPSRTLVARFGDTPPGVPSHIKFGEYAFEPPRLNNLGEVNFIASITPAIQPIEVGAWTTTGGPLRLLAAPHVPLPGAPGSPIVGRNIRALGLNDAGHSLLTTLLDDKETLWVDTPGQPLRRVVTEGDTLPGAPTLRRPDMAWIDSLGRVAFIAQMSNFGFDYGLWSELSGTMQLVAREGAAAPGTGRNINSLNNITMSSEGLLAFDAFLLDSPSGYRVMYAQRPDGSLRIVARTQTPIPGSPLTLSNLYEARINAHGHVAFLGFLEPANPLNPYPTSVWAENGTALQLVAQTGMLAPGAGGAPFFGFEKHQLNDNGDIMFEASLPPINFPGVTETNDKGIWIRPRNGSLKLVAREGDFLDVDPGPAEDLRRISYLQSISAYVGVIPRNRRTFTNQGEILFFASFTDGTSGMFLTQPVPEPSAFALLSIGCLLIIKRPRRLISR